MNDIFVFNRIRCSVSDDNDIVLQGFCSEKIFLNTEALQIVLKKSSGEDKKITARYDFSKAPLDKKNLFGAGKTVKTFSAIITLIEKVEDDERLYMYFKESETDNTVELYSCTGKELKHYTDKLNYCVDSVESDGKNIMIKGWAVDAHDVEFKLVKIEQGKEEDISFELNRYTRSDVAESFAELDNTKDIGFVVKLANNKYKMRLYLSAGERHEEYRVNGSKGVSRIPVVNKAKNVINKTIMNTKNYGLKSTWLKIKIRFRTKAAFATANYNTWIKKRMPDKKELARQRDMKFEYSPLFSILVPLYETDEYFLDELIKSVKNQTYKNWELCFSDGSKDSERLRKIIENYSKADKRIKYTDDKKGPLGISDNTNQAYEIATGEYIVLGDHDDLFTPDALYECVKVLNNKKVDVIYTDEDKTDEKGKKFFGANFKPDFNIDLLRSCNYICHMFVASKKLVDQIGTFNSEYDGAQDYDFILRCVEKANEVYHIPKVLYRWRAHSNSTSERPDSKLYAFEAGRRAIEAHYKRLGIEAIVENGDHLGQYKTTYKIKGNPLISIVIPNKDHVEDLKKCMDSIDEKSDYKNYEYIIVENNSEEDITFEFYKQLEKRDNVNVLYWDKEFNYSAINNFGVKEAKGEYILLLNNDVEVINGDWLSQMLGYCQREEVGIVGARLYYEDDTIQHAGVVIGFGGIAGHTFVTLDEDSDLYQSRTKVACDYSAVTAACLMTKKKIYEEVGGLEEAFKVAFNDIDFCLKVRATGKLVVYNANAKLHHYESKSRGAEDTFEKKERFNSEIKLFRSRWPEILENGDPYYNVNLTLDKADFSIRV